MLVKSELQTNKIAIPVNDACTGMKVEPEKVFLCRSQYFVEVLSKQ